MTFPRPNILSFQIAACVIFVLSGGAVAQSVDNSQAINKRIEDSFTIEKTQKGIRIVGDGTIAKPQVKLGDKIIRLPAAPSAFAQQNEAMRRAKELEQMEERHYKRPLILSAGIFQSGKQVIQIAKITPTAAKQICQRDKGNWPCGRFAKAALQRLVRSNTIACKSAQGLFKLDGRIVEENCKAANYDLANWLVSQGWVDSSHTDFRQLRDAAKTNGLGIWRK